MLRAASNFSKKEGEEAFKHGLVTITQGKKIDDIYHIYGNAKDEIKHKEYKTHIKINLKYKKLAGVRCTCDDFSELSVNGGSFMCSHITGTAYCFLSKMQKDDVKVTEKSENKKVSEIIKNRSEGITRVVRKKLEGETFFEAWSTVAREKRKLQPEALRTFLEKVTDKQVRFKYEYLEVLMPIKHKDLPISFTLKERDDHIVLTTHKQFPIALNSKNDVYLFKNEIYLPSEAQVNNYITIYEKLKDKGELIYKKNEKNYYEILSLLNSITQDINISEELRSFIRKRLKPTLNIYQEGNNIYCNVYMTYGKEKNNILKNEELKKYVMRDHRLEEKIIMEIERYKFTKLKDRFMFIGEDEDLVNMLRNKGRFIKAVGDVIFEDGVMNRMIDNAAFIEASIYQRDGYFDFSYGIKDIEVKELNSMLNSYIQNKSFYKTKHNSFIDFEDEAIKDFFNLLQIANNEREALDGSIRIDKNKSLYLIENIALKKLDFIKGKEILEDMESKFSNMKFRKVEVPADLKGTLRQYQLEGFKWLKNLSELGLGGILADEMGLGKTIQTIAFILAQKNKKVIIICPTSLIYNWKEEFDKFAPSLKVEIIHGNKDKRVKAIDSFQEYDVILTTYGTLKVDMLHYENKVFDYCIIDEGQNIKNSIAQNTIATKSIQAGVRFALTGTPIENNLLELWSIFDFIMPGYLFSKDVFEKKFIEKEDNLEELKLLIKPFILRRTKKEVMSELPDKIEKKFLVQMTAAQKSVYNTYAKQVKESIKSSKGNIEVFSYLTKLRQLCLDPSILLEEYEGGSGKLKVAIELIEGHIETEGKVLVFSQFTSVLNKIGDNLKKVDIEYFYLDGSTKPKDRLKMVKEFNRPDTPKVFLISLRAGGTGLNLTAANLVIHFDPWWNPSVEDQATDRAHRIGQKNIVEVIKLVSKGTIEEKIILLQEDKKHLIHSIINGELKNSNSIYKMSKEELLQLFDR
jgi:SNF2 family DNA or RNA helicase/predicted nucleic acid-binding Zn finger protein